MKKYLLLIIVLFSAFFAMAQPTSQLKTVTVNPNQIDVEESSSGRSITIINTKDIKKMAASSIEEVLQHVEGININSRGGFGVQADVGMRGSTFSQVLVLIDNVRVNEPLTGHYNMYLPIALSEVAQIEIVRGPAASAYGADAVGGLIHIKTKNYLIKKKSTNKEIGTKGSALLGENKLRVIDAVIDSKSDDAYFGGSVNVKSSLGQLFSNPNYIGDSTVNPDYRTQFDIKNYSLFGNYYISENTKLYARASLNTRDFNAKYFYTNSNYDESVEKINSIWTQLGLQTQNKKQKTQIGIAYKQLSDEFIFNPLFAKNNHDTKSIVAFAQQQRTFSKKLSAAYGIQSIFQQIISSDRGDHKNNTHAAFVSLSYQLGYKTTMNGSARVEHNTSYGTSFNPQLGVAYRANKNVVIRSNVGMATRSPDFTELYISTNLPSLSAGRNLGNPNLKAEKSITADLGFDYFTAKEKVFSASFFARQGNQLIDYILTNADVINTSVSLSPNENYFYTQNVSSATSYGVELGINKKVQLAKYHKLRVGLNYTFIQTETKNEVPSKYISNHPGHMANFQLGYEARYIDIVLSNNFRTREQEDNVAILGAIPEQYFVSNAVIRLKPFNGKLNIVGKVLNIFDASYQETLGAPMPQRWFAAGIDWKL